MEKLKTTKILAIIGIAALLLGNFMPYYTFTVFGYVRNISLWGYLEGKIVMVLTIANFLFIFKEEIEKYTPQLMNSKMGSQIQKANPKLAVIPTILIVVAAVWLYIRLDLDTTYLKHGFGFYALWIGVLCLVFYTLFAKKK